MVRGLALVTQGVRQKRGPVPVKTIHLGTAGEPVEDGILVEYNRLLVDSSHRADFARGIVAAVRASGVRWEEFLLDGFVPEDAAPFLEEDPSFFIRREPCPTSDLAAIRAAGGDLIASLGKSTRASVRRGIRGFGNVGTEWAESPAQAENILTELIDLHRRRWLEDGKPGAFAGDRFRAFHRASDSAASRRRRGVSFPCDLRPRYGRLPLRVHRERPGAVLSKRVRPVRRTANLVLDWSRTRFACRPVWTGASTNTTFLWATCATSVSCRTPSVS